MHGLPDHAYGAAGAEAVQTGDVGSIAVSVDLAEMRAGLWGLPVSLGRACPSSPASGLEGEVSRASISASRHLVCGENLSNLHLIQLLGAGLIA